MKYSIWIAILAVLVACSNETEETAATNETEETTVAETDFNARVKREIEAKLQIPPTEVYDFRVFKAHINSDTIEDAIITVNRLQFAKAEAVKQGKVDKSSEIGYMGNYNFFLYYDGQRDLFSVPIPCPSSPGRPLDVTFENITSPTRKDVVIGYRIRNSGWKSYFSVLNESDLALIFQWKEFDNIGLETPEAILHRFEPGQGGESMDIVLYESKIDNYSMNVPDIYQYVPTIQSKGKELYRFTYDSNFGKFKLIGDSKNIPLRNRAIYQGK